LESQNSNGQKSEKTDTAPYIKTIKIHDVTEKADEVMQLEQKMPVVRTESVIICSTKTHSDINSRSRQEESTPNRISVIRTVANIISKYPQDCQPQFERTDDAPAPLKEKTCAIDLRLGMNCEQLQVEENDIRIIYLTNSQRNLQNEASPQNVDHKLTGSFHNEERDYFHDSISSRLASNPIDPWCSSFEKKMQVNRDECISDYCDRERSEDITLEPGTKVCEIFNNSQWISHHSQNEDIHQVKKCITNYECGSLEETSSILGVCGNSLPGNRVSSMFQDDYNPYNVPLRDEHLHNIPNCHSSDHQFFATNPDSECEQMECDRTNYLSTDLDSQSNNHKCVYLNQELDESQSITIGDPRFETNTNGSASHFVPHFGPEGMVKARCMLPKKVIAASYRNCVAHEIESTRAGWLDSTIKDSYLLDLSMKSQ